ncbi:unnamed protein product, partial [Allacma fusca]
MTEPAEKDKTADGRGQVNEAFQNDSEIPPSKIPDISLETNIADNDVEAKIP